MAKIKAAHEWTGFTAPMIKEVFKEYVKSVDRLAAKLEKENNFLRNELERLKKALDG